MRNPDFTQRIKMISLSFLGLCSIALPGMSHTEWPVNVRDTLPDQSHSIGKDGYLGLVTRFHPATSDGFFGHGPEIRYLDESGSKSTTWLDEQHTCSVTLGHWHANGHVETYAVIPFRIRTRSHKVPAAVAAKWESGLGFGARLYPVSILDSRFAPFLGYSLHGMRYAQQTIAGTTYSQTHWFSELECGLMLKTKYLNIWTSFFGTLDREVEVPISRTESASVGLWPYGLQFGLATTVSNLPGMKNLTKPGDPGVRLPWFHGLNLGVGLSVALPDRESRYIRESRPWLDGSPSSDLFPGLSLGYRFDRSGLEWSFNSGKTRQTRSADNYQLDLLHRVTSTELNFFLSRASQWSPYFGFGLAQHDFQVKESDQLQSLSADHSRKYSLLFTLGCEWSASSSDRWWVLSSRIRYFPWLTLDRRTESMADPRSLVPGNLQITILQLSYYPLRHYMTWKGRKQV